MSFWNKKNNEDINSREYEKLSNKITELHSELQELHVKFKVLQTDQDNLRGNFNRKLSRIKKEEVEEEKEETQTINNPVILPYNGTFK